MQSAGGETLSRREIQVLYLLARGLSSRGISEELGISPLTAQTHRRNMLRKLSLNNTQQLIGWGYRMKILK